MRCWLGVKFWLFEQVLVPHVEVVPDFWPSQYGPPTLPGSCRSDTVSLESREKGGTWFGKCGALKATHAKKGSCWPFIQRTASARATLASQFSSEKVVVWIRVPAAVHWPENWNGPITFWAPT